MVFSRFRHAKIAPDIELYLDEMAEAIKASHAALSAGIRDVQTSLQQGRPDDAKRTIAGMMAAAEDARVNLSSVYVPPEAHEAHKMVTAGMRAQREALILMRAGVERNDGSLVGNALAKYESSIGDIEGAKNALVL